MKKTILVLIVLLASTARSQEKKIFPTDTKGLYVSWLANPASDNVLYYTLYGCVKDTSTAGIMLSLPRAFFPDSTDLHVSATNDKAEGPRSFPYTVVFRDVVLPPMPTDIPFYQKTIDFCRWKPYGAVQYIATDNPYFALWGHILDPSGVKRAQIWTTVKFGESAAYEFKFITHSEIDLIIKVDSNAYILSLPKTNYDSASLLIDVPAGEHEIRLIAKLKPIYIRSMSITRPDMPGQVEWDLIRAWEE